MIGALPLSLESGGLELLDHAARASRRLGAQDLQLYQAGVVSEALVIDWRNEGRAGAFDMELIRRLPALEAPLIAFGGVGELNQLRVLFEMDRVAAVGLGNLLAYREHAVQALKRQIGGERIRPASSAASSR